MLGLNFKSLTVACSWAPRANSVENCAKSPASEAVAEIFHTHAEVTILSLLSGWVSEMVQGYPLASSLHLLDVSTKAKPVNRPCLSAYSMVFFQAFSSP